MFGPSSVQKHMLRSPCHHFNLFGEMRELFVFFRHSLVKTRLLKRVWRQRRAFPLLAKTGLDSAIFVKISMKPPVSVLFQSRWYHTWIALHPHRHMLHPANYRQRIEY